MIYEYFVRKTTKYLEGVTKSKPCSEVLELVEQ